MTKEMRGRRRTRLLGTATLLSLSGVWGASSALATTVYTESNLIDAGDGGHFLALVNADLHRPPLVMFTWGSTKAGRTPGTLDVSTPAPFDSYAVFGRDSSGGVFISFSDPSKEIGTSFDTLFPGISESQLASDLLTEGPLVSTFVNDLTQMPEVYAPMGTISTTVHFSVGADYGTYQASFTPIPEPGSCMLILAAAEGVLLVRRRRGAMPASARDV